MFAIVKTGGKQYRVTENNVIRVEKLDVEAGAKVALDQVLMISDGKKTTVGLPVIKGAKVEATVLEQMRDRKVIVFKKKRRHNYRRKKGHRQHLTVLKITKIVAAKSQSEE
jgi:large subunit ribosomal protein L21